MDKKKRLFTEKRTVKWGDCDPAGVIYSPRVFDYVMETLEIFNREILGTTWMDLNYKRGLGVPMVRTEIEFMGLLRPDQEIEIDIHVADIGKSSVTYLSHGFDEGERYFRVKMICCYISRTDFKSIPIPHDVQEILRGYMDLTGGA